MPENEIREGHYVTDVAYPAYPCKLQNPLWMSFMANINGRDTLPFREKFTYLELGCADGISLNIYANLFPEAEFIGVDFNENALEKAKTEAEAAGLKNVRYHLHDIGELADLGLQSVDYVVCIGTFSWLPPGVRTRLMALVPELLSDNGMFLVHHLTRPGANTEELISRIAQSAALGEDDSLSQMRKAVSVLWTLKNKNSPIFADHPKDAEQIESLHALRNDDMTMVRTAHGWLSSFYALYHAEVAEQLGKKGLSHAGSVRPVEYLYLSKVLGEFGQSLRMEENDVLRQTLLDIHYERRDRADLYMKQSPPRPVLGPPDALPDTVSYAVARSLARPVFTGLPERKPIEYSDAFFSHMLDFMTPRPVTLKEFCAEAVKRGINAAQAQNGLWLLLAGNYVEPVLPEDETAETDEIEGERRNQASALIKERIESFRPEFGDLSLPAYRIHNVCTLNTSLAVLLKAYVAGEKDLQKAAMKIFSETGYPLYLTEYLYADMSQFALTVDNQPDELRGRVVESENDMAQIIDRVIPRFREYILPDLRRLGVIN